MAKGIMSNSAGEEVVVREDTAKASSFKIFSATTAAICLALMAVLAILFFAFAGRDGEIESPAQMGNMNANAVR